MVYLNYYGIESIRFRRKDSDLVLNFHIFRVFFQWHLQPWLSHIPHSYMNGNRVFQTFELCFAVTKTVIRRYTVRVAVL